MTDSSGIACMCLLLRFHGIAVDTERLVHGLGGWRRRDRPRRSHARAQGAVADGAGEEAGFAGAAGDHPAPRRAFQILAKVVEGDVLVHDALSGQPRTLARFLAEWGRHRHPDDTARLAVRSCAALRPRLVFAGDAPEITAWARKNRIAAVTSLASTRKHSAF